MDDALRDAERAWRADPNPRTSLAYERAATRAGTPPLEAFALASGVSPWFASVVASPGPGWHRSALESIAQQIIDDVPLGRIPCTLSPEERFIGMRGRAFRIAAAALRDSGVFVAVAPLDTTNGRLLRSFVEGGVSVQVGATIACRTRPDHPYDSDPISGCEPRVAGLWLSLYRDVRSLR